MLNAFEFFDAPFDIGGAVGACHAGNGNLDMLAVFFWLFLRHSDRRTSMLADS
jgi:hypothetical protein